MLDSFFFQAAEEEDSGIPAELLVDAAAILWESHGISHLRFVLPPPPHQEEEDGEKSGFRKIDLELLSRRSSALALNTFNFTKKKLKLSKCIL